MCRIVSLWKELLASPFCGQKQMKTKGVAVVGSTIVQLFNSRANISGFLV